MISDGGKEREMEGWREVMWTINTADRGKKGHSKEKDVENVVEQFKY